MTIGELIDVAGEDPLIPIAYFLTIILTALLAGWLGKGDGRNAPWKYLYSVLVYAVCIPGIFALILSVYQFLFGRRDLLQADIFTQVVPVLAMLLTLAIIRRNISFQYIPGFGRLSGFMMLLACIFLLMYLLDRFHIIAFTPMPFQVLLIVVLGAILLFRFALGRIMA